MASEIGRKYGPYEILGRLGGGGMGYVFRGWDARLHREVAIKLLHTEYAMLGMRERFLREARAASALNHPHICTVFDIGEQDGDPYLVMELLEGETLRDRMYHGSLPVDELVCIAREAAEALGAAHAKGIVHRDIKPANIFLVHKPNKGIQAKVLDFGLAKIDKGGPGARASRSLDLTAVGSTVGTLAYMSPEQARGEPLDSRSDLFSLGVVMYEMATRRIPFQGATSALVFVQLLNHPPEPVRSWNEAIPRELEKIILKLMAKERTARFQTAHELEEALTKLSEKNAGWLRKAVSTVPLVRSSDPGVRDRRLSQRRDSEVDAARDSSTPRFPVRPAPRTPDSSPSGPSSRPSAGVQVLRPVARIPSSDRLAQPGGERAGFAAPNFASGAVAAATSGAGLAVAQESRSRAVPIDSTSRRSRSAVDEPLTDLPGLFEDEAPRPTRGLRSLARPARLAIVTAALLVLVAGCVLLFKRGPFRHPLVADQDSVIVTELDNRTGDPLLTGTIGQALQLALAQSPYLVLRSADSYQLARRALLSETNLNGGQPLAQRAALRTGAKFYLFGAISGTGPPYLIHVDLLQTSSNDVLASAEQKALSLDRIPTAIDQLAISLRRLAGESDRSIHNSALPLSREATVSLPALQLLHQGTLAIASRQTLTAIQLYQQAAAADPQFADVQMRLAVLYRRQRAEVASAEAARLALAAAQNASERTRAFAQYEYEMDTTGDFARAAAVIREYLNRSPNDSAALEALARTLGLQGRMAESLQTAQQAYAENPYNSEAYRQAENALLALDRYEAAEQVDAQAQKLGIESNGLTLTTMYLEGRQEGLPAAVRAMQTAATGTRSGWTYGLYLDNIGQLAAGSAVWRDRARRAAQVPGLGSASAFMLAQGALDRALLGDCKQAIALAHESADHPQGMNTLFNAGIAEAVCGDQLHAGQIIDRLQLSYPQSFAVRGFYLPNLKAALALHDNNPSAALDILRPARQFDLISLTPLLRGQAHVMLHQVQIGIVDFQTVLAHRGLPFVVGSVVYPVAQIGLGRAFAEIGDKGNSAQAYRSFLDLWHSADANQPLLAEARTEIR